jgi:parallel beta-helix repeat protein
MNLGNTGRSALTISALLALAGLAMVGCAAGKSDHGNAPGSDATPEQQDSGGADAIVPDTRYVADGSSSGLEFFVSLTGDDGHPGSAARPFATIGRAQRAVRERKAEGPLSQPITVFIRGGTYRLTEPLVFTPADSGSAQAPISYRAYPNETVVLSGGKRITGLAQNGRFWTATLADVAAGNWYFTQLYVNGQRRQRARSPNVGSYFRFFSPLVETAESRRGFIFDPDDVQVWDNLQDVVIVVLGSWYSTIHHVDRLDLAAQTLWFTNPAGRAFSSWYEKNFRYYVENIREGLDQPGEWYLDRGTGVLTYYPRAGEDLRTADVVAPVLEQTLVRFEGDLEQGRYVEYIKLRDLQLRHTDAHLPADLYDARQAATVQQAGVLADGARHCELDGCEVANMGEHGIWLRDDSHHNTIRRCHIHDLGGGGLYIGENWRWGGDTAGWRGYSKADEIPHTTEHNTVDNCIVHDGGHQFAGAVGIWVGHASHTTLSHNEIFDFTYSGISLGWDWSGHPSTAHHNRVEYNHIHHLGLARMNDLAGIYTLGSSPGTIVRNNVIHDLDGYESSVAYNLAAGIYLDQSSAEVVVEDNIVYNIDNAGLFVHFGRNNRIVNNVFAELRGQHEHGWGMHFMSRGGHDDSGNLATGNIVVAESGKVAKAVQTEAAGETAEPYGFVAFTRNLYFAGEGKAPRFSVSHTDAPTGLLDLQGWRQAGYDTRSVVADPLFVDAASYDYRLQPSSPAHALAVTSIDSGDVGVYGASSWVQLAAGSPPRASDPPSSFTPRVILTLEEDYEASPVGEVPSHTSGTDAARGAYIRVTDQHAADGRHSLAFADAPDLDQTYYPLRVWSNLRVETGTVRVRFDLLNSATQPSELIFEMRDWTGDPLAAGPRLRFNPDGMLAVGTLALPYQLGRWYHVEIELIVGQDAAGNYTLSFGEKGQPARRETISHASAAFETLTWIGFIGAGRDSQSVCYIDNFEVTYSSAP